MQWKWPWARRPGREGAPERKAGWPGGYVALHLQAEAAWTRRDYATLSREGFMKNPVVHRCVRLIAETAAAVPCLLYAGAKEYDAHPALDLLARPNQRQAGGAFLETLYGHLLMSGNAYVELIGARPVSGASAGDGPRELHLLRPDRVTVLATSRAGQRRSNTGRGASGERLPHRRRRAGGALHLSLFHPLDDHYGFPPLEAALTALDTHNAAAQLEQGAARQFRPALRRAGLCAEGGRQPDG